MGKVDRTADEIFDDHVQNFNKQQNAANKLQKELNNYIRCVKGNFISSRDPAEIPDRTWSSYGLVGRVFLDAP